MSHRHPEHALAKGGATTLCGLTFVAGALWVIADDKAKIDCGSCCKLLGIKSAKTRRREAQSRKDRAANEARKAKS